MNGNLDTVVSVLIGALVGAASAFIVRLLLDKRSERRAERKIAYVHLVNVTGWIAGAAWFETMIKALVKQLLPPELSGKPGAFEMSHAMSVAFARLVSSPDRSQSRSSSASIGLSVDQIRNGIAWVESMRIPIEQLAKLPNEGIVAYQLYANSLHQISAFASRWAKSLETNDFDWVSAEVIHGQWIVAVQATRFAHQLRTSLIKFGSVSDRDARGVLDHHARLVQEMLGVAISDVGKLNLAKETIEGLIDSALRAQRSEESADPARPNDGA